MTSAVDSLLQPAVLIVVALALLVAYGWGRRSGMRANLDATHEGAAEPSAETAPREGGPTDLDTALAAVSEAVLIIDPDFRISAANQVAVEWFGIDVAEHPSLMAAARSAPLQELAEAARHGVVEGSIRARDRHLHALLGPRTSGGIVAALRDDTRVERLERARRDLVANISHDLRTPITSLRLLVDAALEGSRSPRRRDMARQMRSQVDVLQSITDGLIELSRIESGRAVFRLEPERLLTLVDVAAGALAPQFRDRDVRLRVHVEPSIVVLADPPQVSRVFANVLENALRFSPTRGTVEISVCPSDDPDLVEIRIMDEGPGIPPSDVERVFERFYRADRSRTSAGAGLGLAIARHIVEGHGGEIRAESPPGAGATIVFTLLLA